MPSENDANDAYPIRDFNRTRELLREAPEDHYLRRIFIVQSVTRLETETRETTNAIQRLVSLHEAHQSESSRRVLRELDEASILFLNGKEPRLKANGEVHYRELRASYDEQILFVIKLAARCAGRQAPDYARNDGWQALKETTLPLRNRVVHGKANPVIDDTEWERFILGLLAADRLLADCLSSIVAMIGELEEELDITPSDGLI